MGDLYTVRPGHRYNSRIPEHLARTEYSFDLLAGQGKWIETRLKAGYADRIDHNEPTSTDHCPPVNIDHDNKLNLLKLLHNNSLFRNGQFAPASDSQ
jgi:hypothetical protein